MTKRSHDAMMAVSVGLGGDRKCPDDSKHKDSGSVLGSEFGADSSPSAKRRRLTHYERELEERDHAALDELIAQHTSLRPSCSSVEASDTSAADKPSSSSGSGSSGKSASASHASMATQTVPIEGIPTLADYESLQVLCTSQQQTIVACKETIESYSDKMDKLRQTATCSICLSSDDETRIDLVYWPECMHPFCWPCLSRYLNRECFRNKFSSHNFLPNEHTWLLVAKPCPSCRNKSNMLDIETARTRVKIPDRVHMELSESNVERDATDCRCVKPSVIKIQATSAIAGAGSGGGSSRGSLGAGSGSGSAAADVGAAGAAPPVAAGSARHVSSSASALRAQATQIARQAAATSGQRKYVEVRKWNNRLHMNHKVRECDERGFGDCALCKASCIPLSVSMSKVRAAIVLHLEHDCTASIRCSVRECVHFPGAVRPPGYRPLQVKDFRQHMIAHCVLEFCQLTHTKPEEIVPIPEWRHTAFKMLESIRDARKLNGSAAERRARFYSLRLYGSDQFKLLPAPSSSASVDRAPFNASDDDEESDLSMSDLSDNEGDDADDADIGEQKQVLESLAAAAAARPDILAAPPAAIVRVMPPVILPQTNHDNASTGGSGSGGGASHGASGTPPSG